MRIFYNPRQRGAHRVAAIALYRAILLRCRAVPVPQVQRECLQNVVRNQFRRLALCSSTRILNVAYNAGYKAVDTLAGIVASGKDNDNTIAKFLSSVKPLLTLPPGSAPGAAYSTRISIQRQIDENGKVTRIKLDNAKTYMTTTSILDRESRLRAQVKGQRKLPVLAAANGVPFLRIKKSQPESLSGYFRQRLRVRQKRQDLLAHLIGLRCLARTEDQWDTLLATHGIVPDVEEPKWEEAVTADIQQVCYLLHAERKRNADTAVRMVAIIDAERNLADRERADCLHDKNDLSVISKKLC